MRIFQLLQPRQADPAEESYTQQIDCRMMDSRITAAGGRTVGLRLSEGWYEVVAEVAADDMNHLFRITLKRDVMQRTVFEKLLPVFRQQRPPAIDRRAAGARERRSGEDRGRLTALAGGSFEQRGTSWASAGGTKFGSVAGE